METKNQIKLVFQMESGDIRLLEGITGRILNVRRIGASLFFSLAMTGVLALAWGGSEATAPLVIFSGLISVIFLILLLYAASARPKIIEALGDTARRRGTLKFRPGDICVRFEGKAPVTVGYEALRGQYWCGERYILYFDDRALKCLISIRIDRDSFDDIYLLAGSLQGRKKRLVRLRVKGEKRGKDHERKNIVENE